MAELNLDDLVLLIHTEVASAVTSAQHYGAMERLSLDSVRVRMGQEAAQSTNAQGVSLNDERYPVAQDGWMIDITYRAAESPKSPLKSQPAAEQWIASRVMPYLASQSVKVLEGVGKIKLLQLQKQGIQRIGQLVEVNREQENRLSDVMGKASFRKLKTMARLALAIPPIELPVSLNKVKLQRLLNQFETELERYTTLNLAGETRIQLLYWLEQLEFCLDDDFFGQLTFERLLGDASR
jgi:predicted flap endonuclease-1-like 5' DNA nuclease